MCRPKGGEKGVSNLCAPSEIGALWRSTLGEGDDLLLFGFDHAAGVFELDNERLRLG